jgi:hypothetical protein
LASDDGVGAVFFSSLCGALSCAFFGGNWQKEFATRVRNANEDISIKLLVNEMRLGDIKDRIYDRVELVLVSSLVAWKSSPGAEVGCREI